jgi:hypothetical protein
MAQHYDHRSMPLCSNWCLHLPIKKLFHLCTLIMYKSLCTEVQIQTQPHMFWWSNNAWVLCCEFIWNTTDIVDVLAWFVACYQYMWGPFIIKAWSCWLLEQQDVYSFNYIHLVDVMKCPDIMYWGYNAPRKIWASNLGFLASNSYVEQILWIPASCIIRGNIEHLFHVTFMLICYVVTACSGLSGSWNMTKQLPIYGRNLELTKKSK